MKTWLFVLSLIDFIFTFNVDVKFPVTLVGKLGSHFGYNVAFLPTTEGTTVLVSAPKANSTLYTYAFEPGVLYNCSIDSINCQEVPYEKSRTQTFPLSSRLGYLYYEGKDTMWLGVSLDVQQEEPHSVMVCGHRWHNIAFEFKANGYFPLNGVCYLLNNHLNSSEKFLPLVNPYQQIVVDHISRRYNVYYYAMGQAGTSAIFSEDGENLILGAPGMYNWIGTALNYGNINDLKNVGSAIVPNPPLKHNISADSYLGYSVTSGRFFHNKELYFVAGAPKDKVYNGRVYIFEALSKRKPSMSIRQRLSGEQMGSYFGASVLSIDLNDDDYQDLLVSAPLFSATDTAGDEGRVFVYISDGVSLQLQNQVIMGRKRPGARFGSAIANCGDLNRDGFHDIAVGAPYDDGFGAIYIYHGSQHGLQSQYSQVIAAKEYFGSSMRGFGISIGRGFDFDHNFYPDLIVGSYLSDAAVVFRSRPVVHIGMILEFSILQINLNEDPRCMRQDGSRLCFRAEACFSAEIETSQPAHLRAVLQLDPSDQQMERDQRGYFFYKGRPTSTIVTNVTLFSSSSCFMSEVDVLEDKSLNYIDPLYFRLSFELRDETPDDAFCPDCPVLDPSSSKFIIKQLPFVIGCGEDDFCIADLKVTAVLLNSRERKYLVHGENTTITIEVTVTNAGEPAYVNQLFIRIPSIVMIANPGRCHIDKDSMILYSILECKLENPLRTGKTEKISFKLDTSHLESHVEEVLIEMEVITTSRELKPIDNIFHMYLPFKAQADIFLLGYADRKVIIHTKDATSLDIVHNYLVTKDLPSPVKSVGVSILVPTTTRETDVTILTIASVEVGDGTPASVSGSCNVTFGITSEISQPSFDISSVINFTQGDKDIPITVDLTGRSGKRSAAEAITDTSFVVNCKNALCTMIVCEVGPFLDNIKPARIRIAAVVNYTSLISAIGEQENVSILTEGTAWIKDYNFDVQLNNHLPDHAIVSTTLIKPGPLPPKMLPKWIIAVSVGGGVLLMGLIILALVKFGFFRRKKKEEMQSLLQEATVVENNTFSNNMIEDEMADALD